MPGMRDRFAHFYTSDDAAVEAAMKTGLVAPDANVLLTLYRFQATARDELFGALEKLDDRLWIPHQAGLEFQRNRLGVMKDQEGYFAKTRDEVLSAVGGLQGKVRAFGNRLGLSEEQTKELDDAISALSDRIADVVLKAEGQNEVRLHGHASDEVLARVDALFADDSSVGNPMEPKDLEAARKEAERRVREKVPPGYKDRDKDDPTGDYIVWRQLMDEAKIRKLPVVFITDDSRSDDWYRREHGMTLGARHELREEMYREAGVPLLMMTTRTFLLHAKTYLNAKVSKETVEQARELPAALDERRAMYDQVRVSLGQDLEELREERLSAEREARHAARHFGILARRFSEAQRDAPMLGDAFLVDAEADLRRAHDARAEAEDRMARLTGEQYRVEGLLQLLERESEAQGDPRSLLEQVYRDRAARRARAAGQ